MYQQFLLDVYNTSKSLRLANFEDKTKCELKTLTTRQPLNIWPYALEINKNLLFIIAYLPHVVATCKSMGDIDNNRHADNTDIT